MNPPCFGVIELLLQAIPTSMRDCRSSAATRATSNNTPLLHEERPGIFLDSFVSFIHILLFCAPPAQWKNKAVEQEKITRPSQAIHDRFILCHYTSSRKNFFQTHHLEEVTNEKICRDSSFRIAVGSAFR